MIKDTVIVAFLVTLSLGAALAWLQPEPSTITITQE